MLKLGTVYYYLIFAVMKANTKRSIDKQTKVVEMRSLRSYDNQLCLDKHLTIDWDKTLASTNSSPDLMASVFYSAVPALPEVYAPLKRIKITSQHAPCIKTNLKSIIGEIRERSFLLVKVQETTKQSYS